jgi:uncharacterized protein
MSAKVIDSFEFSRQRQQLSGQTATSDFLRLVPELADSDGMLHWSFTGGQHGNGYAQLGMKVHGEVRVICQRCLKPLAVAVDSESSLVLARNDGEADEIESRLDDDSVDVIVGSGAMDIMMLVEDEVLLALPLSPRHDICPDADKSVEAESRTDSPFSILKNLK